MDRNFKLRQMFSDYLELRARGSGATPPTSCQMQLSALSEDEKKRALCKKITEEEAETFDFPDNCRPAIIVEPSVELSWYNKMPPTTNGTRQASEDDTLKLAQRLLQLFIKTDMLEASSFKYDDIRLIRLFFMDENEAPTEKLVTVIDTILTVSMIKLGQFSDKIAVAVDYQLRAFMSDPMKAKRLVLETMLKFPEYVPDSWGGEAALTRWKEAKERDVRRRDSDEKDRDKEEKAAAAAAAAAAALLESERKEVERKKEKEERIRKEVEEADRKKKEEKERRRKEAQEQKRKDETKRREEEARKEKAKKEMMEAEAAKKERERVERNCREMRREEKEVEAAKKKEEKKKTRQRDKKANLPDGLKSREPTRENNPEPASGTSGPKKQFALFMKKMSPSREGTTASPDVKQTPPAAARAPAVLVAPAVPVSPAAPRAPAVLVAPAVPVSPAAPRAPAVLLAPAAPVAPGALVAPPAPAAPPAPVNPPVPVAPALPTPPPPAPPPAPLPSNDKPLMERSFVGVRKLFHGAGKAVAKK